MFNSLRVKLSEWLMPKTKESDDWIRPEQRPYATPSDELDVWSSLGRSGITFRLIPANGGIIFCARFYDEDSDEWENSMHLLTDSSQYATSIYECINIELLRAKK